ncbi:protein of unknown function [Clostridium beijerinckii]|nr:protein of unknown function [Clostridium beijerinckii]
MLIPLIILLNLLLNFPTNPASPLNHMADAMQTPNIKYFDISAGSEALNPPNNKDPSIIAWGLSHVTAKQEIAILINELLPSFLSSNICDDDRINPAPM